MEFEVVYVCDLSTQKLRQEDGLMSTLRDLVSKK